MGASERVVSGQPRMQEEQETTPGCMHLIDPPVKSKRKEEAMTKVTWLDLAPPDHPIYKEGTRSRCSLLSRLRRNRRRPRRKKSRRVRSKSEALIPTRPHLLSPAGKPKQRRPHLHASTNLADKRAVSHFWQMLLGTPFRNSLTSPRC